MSKKFDTTAISNELAESAFFHPKNKQPTTPTQTPSTKEERNPEKTNDTVIPRHHDTKSGIMRPFDHETTVARSEDDMFEVVRKAVKQIGKEAATHRFTLEEKNFLADIEYTYKRQGIRTSENEITRIAINYFVEDYRKNGEESLLAKILKRVNS